MEASSEIGPEYFDLPIDGGDTVFRERVYCYELYHQMRTIWPAQVRYRLNAEVDKGGHPLATNFQSKNSKPDFLVHTPGEMRGNDTIIEVKPVTAKARPIGKDLATLSNFLNEWQYQNAILLFYGTRENSGDLLNRVRKLMGNDTSPRIEIWHHGKAGQAAKLLGNLT